VMRVRGLSSALVLDYPVHPRVRYGWGSPSHPGLEAMISPGLDRYRGVLSSFLAHRERLSTITGDSPAAPGDPQWVNSFIPGLDGVALYSFVADARPTHYLEVGSGNSTKFVKRAVRDHGLATKVVSIDPYPRAEVDALCDEVIRLPVEDADLGVFDRLVAGDVLFIDNSHRAFQNSDATVMLTEVVPSLPAGVLVGVHDIFLPDDYPAEWSKRYYSEQYLLAAWLLGGGNGCEIVLPTHYIRRFPELDSMCDPIWSAPELAEVQRHGGAFWFRTG
jgi:Methyltransferase domain